MNEETEAGRSFLRDDIRQRVDFRRTAQARGLPPPPVQLPCPADAVVLDLPRPAAVRAAGAMPLSRAIARRRSLRRFSDAPLSLEAFSFLLWSCQGVRGRPVNGHAFRTVPSAGCRHALETYLAVFRVDGLAAGLYRYLPVSHRLLARPTPADLPERVSAAALGQHFAGAAAVAFFWTAVPGRMEWRYGAAAHKVIALDAGHACQNLCLAAVAAGGGACAIAAYEQEAADRLLGVDGQEEFTIYLAAVGRT